MVVVTHTLKTSFIALLFVCVPRACGGAAGQDACVNEAELEVITNGNAFLQRAHSQIELHTLPEDVEEDGASQPWEKVDGGSGRACRGGSADRAFERYALYRSVDSLGECKELCAKTPLCTGVAHDPSTSRCEVWTTPIRSSVAQGGHTCLRFRGTPAASPLCTGPSAWELVGSGPNMACRGESACDYNISHFALHSLMPSLADCKAQCASAPFCTGIGYDDYGRCEVWLKSIGASAPQTGSTCLRYTSGTPRPVHLGSNASGFEER